MTLVEAIILGLVEGVTEFLPVSSTAHLIFTSQLLGLEQTDFVKFFIVFIQAGAICAVALKYAQYVMKNKHLIKSMIVAFIPTALIGFLMYNIIKNVFFESHYVMILVFFLTGFIFLIVELLVQHKKISLTKDMTTLTTKDALIIGLLQVSAIMPGVSRSGAVLITMMILGYKRKDAALFSFFLAVPTITAASVFDLYSTGGAINNMYEVEAVLVGFVVAFASAYLVIRWFIRYLQNHSLNIFGWYRIFATIAILILFSL